MSARPPKAPDRQAAADDFAEAGEVGGDLLQLLHAATGEAEAGHDLVEDEQGIVGGGYLADVLEVPGIGLDEADVADVRLEDDAGDLAGVGREGGIERGGVVEGKDDCLARKRRGDAGTVRMAVGKRAGAGLDEQRVTVPVVAAGELDDLVALGEAARQADGRHRRLGAAAAHPDLLDRWEEGDDELGHLDLIGIGRAEGRAIFQRGGDGGLDARVIVSVDGRAPGADEVDQLAVVGRGERRALGRFREERRPAHGPERPDRRVHPTGNELLGTGEKFFGGRHGGLFVDLLAVAYADHKDNQHTIFNAANDAMVAHPPAPQAMQFPAERLAESPGTLRLGEFFTQITGYLAGSGWSELSEVALGRLIQLNAPGRAHVL